MDQEQDEPVTRIVRDKRKRRPYVVAKEAAGKPKTRVVGGKGGKYVVAVGRNGASISRERGDAGVIEVITTGDVETTPTATSVPPRHRATQQEIADLKAFGVQIEREVLTNLGIDPNISTKDLLRLPLDFK